jgi:hypothetical protein
VSWKFCPHGPITPVVDGVWQVQGTLPGGNPLPRTMVLWRLPSGGLCIHSAVNLSEESMAELEALGTPEILLVPNRFHRMDAPAWKARYPDLRVIAPKAARRFVDQVVPTDANCETVLPPLEVEVIHAGGLKPLECIYKLGAKDAYVLIFTDTLFNVRDHLPGFSGFVMRYLTGSTGFFGLTRLARVFCLASTADYKSWLGEQKHPSLTAIVVGHGPPIQGNTDCMKALNEAIERL